MLSARHRLRDSTDIRRALRGRRAGGHLVVVHAVRVGKRRELPPRVGFVVSRAVGGAVTRNLVKRRLRGHVAGTLGDLPDGVDVLVRANPPAAQAEYAELATEYDRLLARVLARLDGQAPRASRSHRPQSGSSGTSAKG